MYEDQNIEWKESWRDEHLREICGFANAGGGKLYIGKDDNGNVVDVPDCKKLLEYIPSKVKDILGIIVDVNLCIENKKKYLEIVISPSSYPVSYKGEYHYRTGSTKQLLYGQTLSQFLLKKLGMTWDGVAVQDCLVRELRNDWFDYFREQALLSRRMTKDDLDISNEQLLEKLNLLDNCNLRRAAILLFHHNPEKWFAGAYIKIGFFESDSEIRYQDEIHGSLLSQAERVLDVIYTKYLRAEISYQVDTRIEKYPFPREVIREAVFNAIVHKNYGSLIPIQISVYKDRLYIANEWVLPENWTIDDLLSKHTSRPYNPFIANTFYRMGFIESWGRGIQKIQEGCLEAGNPLPEYTVKPYDIMVMFKKTPVSDFDDNSEKNQIVIKDTPINNMDAVNAVSEKSENNQYVIINTPSCEKKQAYDKNEKNQHIIADTPILGLTKLELERYQILKEYFYTHRSISSLEVANLLDVNIKIARQLLFRLVEVKLLKTDTRKKNKHYEMI